MRQIAKFFTLYWCIYFPTCIAYNDLPGFSSVDEVMTGVLVIYTFMMYGKRRALNNKPKKEWHIFIGVLLFFTAYGYGSWVQKFADSDGLCVMKFADFDIFFMNPLFFKDLLLSLQLKWKFCLKRYDGTSV